ncbi:MAG: hypothetical protein ACPG7E_02910 [Marinirhabdus sp.]
MDHLDLLKKDWQKAKQQFPKKSATEIYAMLLKKSSSIVKWIFIISIAEVVFWNILALLVPESSKKIYELMGLETLMLVTMVFGYVVTAVFLYLFYRNYIKIKVTDTIKQLMTNILRTRKVVRYFVYYNIGASILLLVIMNVYYYFRRADLYEIFSQFEGYKDLPPENFNTIFFTAQLIVGVGIFIFLVLFYRIVYGILLRRLKRNYKELKKIEL